MKNRQGTIWRTGRRSGEDSARTSTTGMVVRNQLEGLTVADLRFVDLLNETRVDNEHELTHLGAGEGPRLKKKERRH